MNTSSKIQDAQPQNGAQIPVHVSKRNQQSQQQMSPNTSQLKDTDIYVGNLHKNLPLHILVTYLERRGIQVHDIRIIPNKSSNCNCAKARVSGSDKVLHLKNFFPDGEFTPGLEPLI